MKLQNKFTWQAFEVEDIGRRENYVFVYNPYDQAVEMYDTSVINNTVGRYKKVLKMRQTKDFPYECESAYEYFKYLYNKSTKFESNNDIYFWSWVHPVTFQPIDELKKRMSDHGIVNSEEIKRLLRQKHKEFCSSIRDFKLRKLFRKHTFFAGGCIASLIKGEDPKDFDIFFDDLNTLDKILRYYVCKHNERYSEMNKNYKLEVNTDNHSVNLFLKKPFVHSDEDNNSDMNPIIFSMKAISFPNDFQLILDFNDYRGRVVDRFDFVHSMGYFHPYENKLIVKEETLAAIQENQLVYNMQGENPIGSAKRLLRFVSRGWNIENKEHMKLLKRISKIDNDEVFDLEGEEYFF